MATCKDCGAQGRWGFDVVSKRWILLDPHPVPRARYALVRNKAIVDMLPLPLTLDEIPARELIGLSIEQRTLLRQLYEEERYRTHRTAGCGASRGVFRINVVLREVLIDLEARVGTGRPLHRRSHP